MNSTQRIIHRHAQGKNLLASPKIQDHLPPALRRTINAELNRAGMDGNGRFVRIGDALAKIGTLLGKHQLEWDTTLNSHMFMGDTGRRTLNIAFSDPKDPFNPMPINNSMVTITWHQLENDMFEVLAYLS